MGVNFQEIYSVDPFASGGTADAYKRRLLAAQLLQKKASEDEKVFSNQHGGMKLATALLGGMMEGWEENKAKRGQAEGYDALLKMYTGGGGLGGLGGSGVSALPSSPSMPSRGSPAGAPSLAGGGASRAMSMPIDNPALASAIEKHATAAGLNPVDLATAMSYETAGTFDPWKKGPTTKWGTHRGLIQWGEPQARQYGVGPDTPVEDQVAASVKYLQDRGVKPGHGLMEIYSAINAGGVGPQYLGRSDSAAGGAPGTVADKVNNQMAGHRAKAEAIMGSVANAPQQVASADPGFMPGPLSEADAGLPPEVAAATPVTAEQPPAPTWQTAQATPEEFDAQLGVAQGDAASMAPVAPLPPQRPVDLEALQPQQQEAPPPPPPPSAPRVPPQAMAQALMAGGGPPIDPNSNNAGAQQFAAAGMGRGGQGMPQAPQHPPPQMAAPQAPSAPPGMYGGGAQPNAQYAQAGPVAQQPQLPQQQAIAQQTAAVAQAGGMTPEQLFQARRTLNSPYVSDSVKSQLLQYIQKRYAPPSWKYENVAGYGLVAVNDRNPNDARDVRRVPRSPTVVSEGGTAIGDDGKVIYQGGPKSTDESRNYQDYVRDEQQRGGKVKSRDEWDLTRRRSQVQNEFGTIPPGHRLTRNPDGSASMEPIPGSPAEREQKEAAEKATKAKEMQRVSSDVVIADSKRALEIIDKAAIPVTGAGNYLANVKGTSAHNLEKTLDSIKSNIGFDKLQQMRLASPTGGALGQVAVQEMIMLQAAYGSLAASQSEKELKHNLSRLHNMYLDVVHGRGTFPELRLPLEETTSLKPGETREMRPGVTIQRVQ
jgi:hypothetical protein